MTERSKGDQDLLALTVCPECGYSLEGLPREGVCPECGERYDQQYIVLFGETPEGMGRATSWLGVGVVFLMALFFVFMSLRHGQLMGSGGMIVLVSILLLYLMAWAMRRASVKKEILFQVWLNQRGFAVRGPKSERNYQLSIERALPFAWIIYFVALQYDSVGRLSLPWVAGIVCFFLLLVWLISLINRPTRRRQVKTGDDRQPILTAWDRNDSLTLTATGNTAHLRITSRSFLGPWKWQEWHAVDAVVGMSPEQVTVLRQRLENWISIATRHRRVENEAM